MEKYQNKYRIPSARLEGHDYGAEGAYFITICTANREHFFGKIADNSLIFSDMGKLAQQFWMEIPQHFLWVELGAFVVMPNHIHGILFIHHMEESDEGEGAMNGHFAPSGDVMNRVSTTIRGGFSGQKNPMLQKNMARVIRWYKGRVCFEIRKTHAGFAWQTRFHDHIIRNIASFERIQYYIEHNPTNWGKDTFYT